MQIYLPKKNITLKQRECAITKLGDVSPLQVHIEKNVLFGTAAKETMRAKFKGIDDRKLAEQVCHLQMTLHNFIQKKCF